MKKRQQHRGIKFYRAGWVVLKIRKARAWRGIRTKYRQRIGKAIVMDCT